jgi:HK97 family phage portal protein
MKLFGFNFGRTKAAVSALGMADWVNSVLLRNGEAWPGSWQAGVTIECPENLLKFSAVYSCIGLIADDIAKLRIKLMSFTRDGIWQEVRSGHPALAVLRRPNRYMTRIQFLSHWITSLLLYGNAYALVERDQRRNAVAMYPLDPRRVLPATAPDGEVYYQIQHDWLSGLSTEGFRHQSEVIHDRMSALWHPLVGVSPIYACATSATQGVRIQNNSATFFRNMSRPSGQLTAPGTISDETAARLKLQFEQNFSANNLGRLFIGGDGLKYEPWTIPAHDAQLIEQLRWTVEDVARCFHVPNQKLGIGVPTITNVVALNQDYYAQCLQTRIEAIEELLGHALGLPDDMRIELDLDGLLRMDPVSQIDVLQKGVAAAVIAPNEARARLNLPPVDGGEFPLAQQQNWSLARLAERPAPSDPAPAGPTTRGAYRYRGKNGNGEFEDVRFNTQIEFDHFMRTRALVDEYKQD